MSKASESAVNNILLTGGECEGGKAVGFLPRGGAGGRREAQRSQFQLMN